MQLSMFYCNNKYSVWNYCLDNKELRGRSALLAFKMNLVILNLNFHSVHFDFQNDSKGNCYFRGWLVLKDPL